MLGVAPFGDHRQELLDEEGISLGDLADPDVGGVLELRAADKLVDQLIRLSLGKRLKRDRLPAPTRALVEEFRPSKTEKEKRSVAGPVREMLD
jgi:hypothetical protein